MARWREERAIASDKPRGWILPDEALFAMAALAPRSLDELATVRALQPAVHRKRGEELLALIDAARETTDDLAAADLSGRRLEPGENALVAQLIDEVRAEAAQVSAKPLAPPVAFEGEAMTRSSTKTSNIQVVTESAASLRVTGSPSRRMYSATGRNQSVDDSGI